MSTSTLPLWNARYLGHCVQCFCCTVLRNSYIIFVRESSGRRLGFLHDASLGSCPSFSQGFFRVDRVACEACPVSSVFGISLMPGIGCPVVTNSTICAKDVGYGAGGSFEFADAVGKIPPALSVLGEVEGACAALGVMAGRPQMSRYAL